MFSYLCMSSSFFGRGLVRGYIQFLLPCISPTVSPGNIWTHSIDDAQGLGVFHEFLGIWILIDSPPLTLAAKEFLDRILRDLFAEEYFDPGNSE